MHSNITILKTLQITDQGGGGGRAGGGAYLRGQAERKIFCHFCASLSTFFGWTS